MEEGTSTAAACGGHHDDNGLEIEIGLITLRSAWLQGLIKKRGCWWEGLLGKS
jgi:hypothetical protein